MILTFWVFFFFTFKRLVIITFKGYFFLGLEVSDSYVLRLVFSGYGFSFLTFGG